MVLLDSYITGPACLRQTFQLYPHEKLLSDFWAQRNRFTKDLSPTNVYYWDDEIIEGYKKISSLINLFDENNGFSTEEIEHFTHVLEQFLGVDLDRSILKNVIQSSRQSGSMIIQVNRSLFDLSTLKISTPKTCLRKIEVNGNSQSVIRLFDVEYTVPAGQCIYAVATNGRFVLILPRELECECYKLSLINHPGSFASSLQKQGLLAGYTDQVFDNIVSFAIIKGNKMIRVYNDGELMGDGASKLVVHGYPAIYTTSDKNNNNGIVLYKRGNGASDCLLKTTIPGTKKTASYAGFNIHGHLIGLSNDR